MSPLNLIKLKIAQKQPARLLQYSVEPSVFVRTFLYQSYNKKNLCHFRRVYQKFIFKLKMVDFNM